MRRTQIQRQKLLNAMIFFAKNTRHCRTSKLFKLLYFLDFEIFRITGRNVTGLDYFAWPLDPVPEMLYEELDAPKPDLEAAVFVTKKGFKPRRDFKEEWFTPREMAVLHTLVAVYQNDIGTRISEAAFLPTEPWGITPIRERIPYTLVLDSRPDSIGKEQAALIAEEDRELSDMFG